MEPDTIISQIKGISDLTIRWMYLEARSQRDLKQNIEMLYLCTDLELAHWFVLAIANKINLY